MTENEEVEQETTSEGPLVSESTKEEAKGSTAPLTPQEPRKTFISIAKSSPFYNDVSKIFHWRDPLKSGLLFGILNLFFFTHYLGRIYYSYSHFLSSFGSFGSLLWLCQLRRFES